MNPSDAFTPSSQSSSSSAAAAAAATAATFSSATGASSTTVHTAADITAAASADHCSSSSNDSSNDMKKNTASSTGTSTTTTATVVTPDTAKTTNTAAAAAAASTTTDTAAAASSSTTAATTKTVAAIAVAAAAAAQQQQQQRRSYIAQLNGHFRNALKKLGVAVAVVNDDDNDKVDDGNVSLRIESMSTLIHESMSISSRNYHSVQHALDVANGLMDNNDDDDDNIDKHLNDPIAILAALFHDCVYYHVDGGLSQLQLKKLKGAVPCNSSSSSSVSKDDAIICQAHSSSSSSTGTMTTRQRDDDDVLLNMVEYIFGYEHFQSLRATHATGLNEFLSAMIAVRELEPLGLSRKQLAQIACCIEMTIPFRPNITMTSTTTSRGHHDDVTTAVTTTTTTTPADRLYANMVQANEKFALNMTSDEIVQSVQRACLLAHSDLANFGTNDVVWFLDNTWSLLPESNEPLRHQYLYTVQQFQFAVFKMHAFFAFLSPDVIFPSFRNVPSASVMQNKYENAKRNLQVGRRYVGAKLLSISILSAIAELTGGDAPISLFMGDLPSRHAAAGTGGGSGSATGASPSSPKPTKRRLGDGLGLPPAAELLHHHRDENAGDGTHDHGDDNSNDNNNDEVAFIDTDVYNLLAFGRRSETDFDIRQSPLAAYLYGSLGNAGLDDLLDNKSDAAKNMLWPMSEAAAWILLQRIPLESVLTPIVENMCQVATSRSDKILSVLAKLKQREQEQAEQR
jgi:hypothetical protein